MPTKVRHSALGYAGLSLSRTGVCPELPERGYTKIKIYTHNIYVLSIFTETFRF
jgi:hypothetical protein